MAKSKARALTRDTRRKPRAAPGWGGATVYAIGHSTLPIEEFVARLVGHSVATLADVRTIPRSRYNPQYESGALAGSVRAAGIAYDHLPRLGGLRRRSGLPDSVNGAWRNASFRNFADYMQTEDFAEGLKALQAIAKRGPVAVMCAEGVPWRCHRSLVADALFARGVVVRHIRSRSTWAAHVPTSFARIRGREVTYPPAGGALQLK